MSLPVALAAGGTGGHVFPAQALAAELGARGAKLVLVTDQRGRDHDLGFEGIETHTVHAGGLGHRGIDRRLLSLASTAYGTVEAFFLLRRLRPTVVVGFGGYPSLPTIVAATRLGLPCILHEQNAILGRANRFVAARVSAIATSFPETRRLDGATAARIVHTGNPVRPAIAALSEMDYTPPDAGERFRLLVFGGSQGARSFSTILPSALANLPENLRSRLLVTQQCRPEDIEAARTRYAADGIVADLSSFFDDMDRRLAAAHLVVSRAGASTVAELAVAGRPAILVPFPFSADDHQGLNAEALVAAGGGWQITQRELTAAALTQRVESLAQAPGDLARAAAAARSLARPDAARDLANLVDAVTLDGNRVPSSAAGAPTASEGTT